VASAAAAVLIATWGITRTFRFHHSFVAQEGNLPPSMVSKNNTDGEAGEAVCADTGCNFIVSAWCKAQGWLLGCC